jgi:hypothetical protein
MITAQKKVTILVCISSLGPIEIMIANQSQELNIDNV